jgi:hypothetical protein
LNTKDKFPDIKKFEVGDVVLVIKNDGPAKIGMVGTIHSVYSSSIIKPPEYDCAFHVKFDVLNGVTALYQHELVNIKDLTKLEKAIYGVENE